MKNNNDTMFEKYSKTSQQIVVDRSYRNYMQKMKELGLVKESGSGRWKRYSVVV